jgi:predicted nucleic acid-binding protein
MIYVDTSVLVAYLLPETYSEQAERALQKPEHYPIALSAWTETELHSALGIKCRTSQIDEVAMRLVLERFFTLRSHFLCIEVIDADYRVASSLLGNWRTGLRAGDALHLAIAQRLACPLISLDERLVNAGNQAGIQSICLR